jgi:hypothetical protein
VVLCTNGLFIFAQTSKTVQQTLDQFDAILTECRELFLKKTKDYGTAWRILRPTSITDQLLIKARRIRSIEEIGTQKVEDSVEDDYVGLINYSIMAILQLHLTDEDPLELEVSFVLERYDREVRVIRELLAAKNHDYGEVWRDMRISSITDLILMKLLRIKQIEDNAGKTLASEGLEANYRDIVNYAVFSLIMLEYV